MDNNAMYICPLCGGKNIQVKGWVLPNENFKFVEEFYDDETDCWCNDCSENVEPIIVDFGDENIIGFQVVNDYGDIHPQMVGRSCVYNLTQIREMLSDNDETWEIILIKKGELKRPKIMFEGKPYE